MTVQLVPVFVRRSDGVPSVHENGVNVPNVPAEDQLAKSTDKAGNVIFFREVHEGDSKHVDWRRKLAEMLAKEINTRELRSAAGASGLVLAWFPENYRLYEYCRVKPGTEGPEPSRSDAYMYGHPQGRRKRYRSPAEFFPHLLWLATDPKGDRGNCGCKMCSTDDLSVPAHLQTRVDHMTRKLRGLPYDEAQIKPAPVPVRQEKTVSKPLSIVPARNHQQSLDFAYGSFVYRPGEVVWFRRENTSAWGLGTIFRRQQTDSVKKFLYFLQPLSNPLKYQPAAECTQDSLRPWLSWSPPPFYSPGLNPPAGQPDHITFEAMNWQDLINGKFGKGDPDPDASILAAKMVEKTYTLIELLKESPSPNGKKQKEYNGLYLGAEKIWRGEPVVIKGQGPSELLLVTKIFRSDDEGVIMQGNVFSYRTFAPDEEIPSDLPISERMRMEAEWRNRILQTNGLRGGWIISRKNARVPLSDVKCRWYEVSQLIGVIDYNQFQENAVKGIIFDASLWMNPHGACNVDQNGRPRTAWVEKSRREDAFRDSVPTKTFRIVEA